MLCPERTDQKRGFGVGMHGHSSSPNGHLGRWGCGWLLCAANDVAHHQIFQLRPNRSTNRHPLHEKKPLPTTNLDNHPPTQTRFLSDRLTDDTYPPVSSIANELPTMSDNGEIEVEAVSGYQVLPKDIVNEIGSVKLFNKWSYEDVEIRDISLT